MRSVETAADDDRTTKARIRDAAIECVARHGLGATTVRKVAETAGVSPGLVIHHFETMEGLRLACDQHVAAAIRDRKEKAMAEGPGLDVLGSLREADYEHLLGYLASVLMDDSDLVNRLVDDLAGDAERYTEHGVANGMLRPSDDPRGRAVLLTLWSLGGLALHHHMKRLLGVDLTDAGVTDDPRFIDYVRPAMEIMGRGMFTDEFSDQIRAAFPPPDDKEDDE